MCYVNLFLLILFVLMLLVLIVMLMIHSYTFLHSNHHQTQYLIQKDQPSDSRFGEGEIDIEGY